MSLDRDRLVKILGLTGSAHDGEAIAALRKAQAMLAAEKLTWGELLNGGGGGAEARALRNAMDLAKRLQQELVDTRNEAHRLRERAAALQAQVNRMEREAGHADSRREFQARAGIGSGHLSDEDLHRIGLEVLDSHPEWLSAWEIDFLKDWRKKSPRWGFSDKQREAFQRIYAKADARVKGYG